MSNAEKMIVGLMSGTSVDGIDAALVRVSTEHSVEVIETLFTPFNESLRQQINQIAFSNEIERCEDSDLHQILAEHYATASLNLIQKSGFEKSSINAIANHGQTVRHEPNAENPFSIQLGDPQQIADATGIITIAQFRQADLAAGGQGAPLMPAFHSAVFGGSMRYLLNVGGIANITQLSETVIGFDTGPGNTLMDQWIQHSHGKAYDANGEWAAKGKVQPDLLNRLLDDPYFSQPYPKSTGPDYFNLAWLGDVSAYQPCDVQATLLELTVSSIVGEIRQLGNIPGEIFVCGGGAHNQTFMRALASHLPNFTVRKTDDLGIPSDWVEAAGFAWLGYCRLVGIPSNLPSVTGARETVVLGDVFLPV